MVDPLPGHPFSCPHCGLASYTFHTICPACGRPYFRDYIDVRMHPRDPDPIGRFANRRFWARAFLVLAVLMIFILLLIFVYR
jgi:hypothetical protein